MLVMCICTGTRVLVGFTGFNVNVTYQSLYNLNVNNCKSSAHRHDKQQNCKRLAQDQDREPKLANMAPGQKMYPRATVKKIVKAHSKCSVSKNADVMIFLDYVLFMQTLVKEAAIDAKQSGERGISARSVKKATADTLAKFKG
ncbi:hypothetical protein F4821DRAFT_227361 [Hypoxylon rubiginosum]|uniref:Uncharacterized protein n=1 Tax=Hypoxylon rubiginosum TaxID=110542 RepID=A0ACC0DE89_9PEZI|nr:hypothetical protein F4821DRAFT_227361 [Hypoxylon rubiginosum]